MKRQVLLLSCEHGGTRVPASYRHLFRSRAAREALGSHRGSDLGALALARSLARSLGAPLHLSTVTRLLVDLNRSLGHPRLYSEFSRTLGQAEREALLDRYYFPYRVGIESWIEDQVRRGHQVVHIGIHSFASDLGGLARNADLGLLYDPSRTSERVFCQTWQAALGALDPLLRVRRNYPYLGKADGLTTHLRASFASRRYLGIELEANQALLATTQGRRRATKSTRETLQSVSEYFETIEWT